MSGRKEQQALAYWSSRSAEYSKLHMDAYGSEKRIAFARQVAKSMPTKELVEALDLGCGSGFMSLLLLDAGCRVTGIDFSAEMLECARSNIAQKGYEANFLQMRAQQLDFPDESFDYVVSRNVTWMLEDVETVYAEVMRVLRPGGIFLNCDANYGSSFNAATARGELPTHPTQTLEQLCVRNDIVRDLPITLVDRPQWDIGQFWSLGAGEIGCYRIGEGTNVGGSQMFAIEVHKSAPNETVPQTSWVNAHVDVLSVGSFEFDSRKFIVRKDGVPIVLTPKEFNILLTLALNAGETVESGKLVEASWGSEYASEHSNVAVYIRRIRQKIEDDPSNPRHILTRWGKGYSFDPV
ncbi:MAG: methyltransferase domain-containing protein [Eggerthellaceae bacterium]|nr:methyltransferase domain-containing protein [Eggerthellaceae bacterium]